MLVAQPVGDAVAIFSVPRRFPIMTGTSRPCQRYSRGPAKLKDGFRIMFRLLYRAFLLFFVVVLFFLKKRVTAAAPGMQHFRPAHRAVPPRPLASTAFDRATNTAHSETLV